MKASRGYESTYTATVYSGPTGLPPFMTLEQTSQSEEHWDPVISHRVLQHCEILYVMGGAGRIAINDSWFEARVNQVFFVPPMVPLDLVTQEENKLDLLYSHFQFEKDHDYRRLTGPPDYLLHEINSHRERTYPNMLVLPDQMLLPPDNPVLQYLRAALDTFEAQSIGFYQEACLLLLCALHRLSSCFMEKLTPPSARARGTTTGLAKRIRSYLLSRLDTFSGMKELGNAFSMNSTHLSRVFKSAYGESVLSFVNRVRVELAKKFLMTTDKTISEVAKASGFRTTGHFQRMFRKRVGFSAFEFRTHRDMMPTPTIDFSTPFDPPPDGRTSNGEPPAGDRKE